MHPKPLAPQKVTTEQREWLEGERKKTGSSISVIVRGLIQKEVNKAKRA